MATERINKARTFLKKGYDAFFLSTGKEIQFFIPAVPPTALENAYFIISRRLALLFLKKDFFKIPPLAGVEVVDLSLLGKRLAQLKSEDGIQKLAIVSRDARLADYLKLRPLFGATNIEHEEGLLQEMQSKKEPGEIRAIGKACQITAKVLTRVPRLIQEGRRENELAWMLEKEIRENGGSGLAFSSVVAFGKHTVFPHHQPTGKRLARGEVIIIDIGAACAGYCSDMTRTYFFGKMTSEFISRYSAVLAAQKRCLGLVRAGCSTKKLYNHAKKLLAESELAQYFIHGLGHGVGISIHEYPSIGGLKDVVIKDKMVITIEPGIYLPGKYGIRVEDTVLVKGKRGLVLGRCPKDLLSINIK